MSTAYTQGGAHRLHLRLFLEGIEVPVISAQVQANLNAPATASIQVVPTDKLFELKPRTLVHLFFYDFTTGDLEEPKLKDYKLIFGGEVVGIQYAKTPTARQAVLQCADWSSYWDTTYQLFLDYSPHGNVLTEKAALWGGGNRMFDNIIRGHSSELARFLVQRPKTPGLRGTKGLLGGVINTLEKMGGVPNHSKGVNDFFAVAELRLRILQQLAAEEADMTPVRVFRSKEFMEWITRGISSVGRLITFRTMLKLLLRYIYYDVVPNPAPPYIPGGNVSFKASASYLEKGVEKQLDDLQEKARTVANRSANALADLPPERVQRYLGELRSNLVSDIIDAIDKLKEENKGYRKAPRKTKSLVNRAASSLQTAYTLLQKTVTKDGNLIPSGGKSEKDILTFVHDRAVAAWHALKAAKSVNKDKSKKFTLHETASARLPMQILRPDCFFVTPPKCNVFFPEQYTQMSYQRSHLQEVTRVLLQTGMAMIGNDKLLSDYFLAPNMKEVRKIAKEQGTRGYRILLPWEKYTGIIPKYEYISDIVFYAGKRQRELDKQQRRDSGSAGKNVVGSRAAYAQRVANFNYMKHRFAPRAIRLSMRFNPFVAPGFPALVIDKPFHISEETIKESLKSPSLDSKTRKALDSLLALKSSPLEGLSTAYAKDPKFGRLLGAPSQFLGMVISMAHSITQTGGTTSVTLTHVRTHRATESDFLEFYLKAKERDILSRAKYKTFVIDIEQAIKEGKSDLIKACLDATPQEILVDYRYSGKEMVSASRPITDVSKPGVGIVKVVGADLASWPNGEKASDTNYRNLHTPNQYKLRDIAGDVLTVPGLKGPTKEVTHNKNTFLVPDGPIRLKPGMKFGKYPIQKIRVLDDQIKVSNITGKNAFYWSKVAIDTGTPTKAKVTLTDLPIEEVVRPSWFSPLYSNLYIGKYIYRPFFGTESLVDDVILTPSTPPDEKLDLDRSDFIDMTVDDVPKLKNIPHAEAAIDLLAFLYGEIRSRGLDVQRFIMDYTYRPIATMEDIFGSEDLELEKKGDKVSVKSGKLGFHSMAIAPYDNLVGLLDDPDTGLPRLSSRSKKDPVSKDLDPRKGRREKVEKYVEELASGGGLGTGVVG